ncbi:MAG: hypothetical protein JWO32_515 [Bacteroidetes bacterium]|nr:hypothetical protein [Bacteroidota bacterium]
MRLLPLIVLTLFSVPTFAQNAAKTLVEADELFSTNKFGPAFAIYSDLIKKDPLNANLNYKVGTCYLKSRSLKSKAAFYLEKAVELSPSLTHHADLKPTDAPTTAYLFLGDAYCLTYKFDKAINCYEKYKSFIEEKKPTDPAQLNAVNGKIETCKFGKELKDLVTLPVKFIADKPGKPIDSTFRYCSTALSQDKSTMILTYKIPVSKLQKTEDATFFEETPLAPDTVSKENNSSKKPVYVPMPDTVIYVTTIGSSVDGQIILTYKNERGDGNLYISKLKNNQWSVPAKINKSTNLAGWEPNECMTPDGNTLFFVSDRKGGYGGKDIYKCKKLPDGEWGKAVNLGPEINSAYDDVAPYIYPDGTTLFFSSNRNKPKEFFDNYVSTISDSNITIAKPVVVGYPVDNSSENSFYEVAADKKKIITPKIISAKKLKQLQADSLKEKAANADNYIITFINQKKTPLTLLKGQITCGGTVTSNVQITVTNNETGLTEGIYHADAATGKYSFILSSGKNNNITYQAPGYLFLSENKNLFKETENFEKGNIVNLSPVAKKSKTTLNNIFFEDDKGVVLKTSQTEIKNLVELLSAYPTMVIKLNNCIFSDDNKKFYKRLSEARARAVKEALVAEGIKDEQIIAKGSRKKNPKQKGHTKSIIQPLTQKLTLEIIQFK